MILRVYKTGDTSWVSPGALLAAIKTKEDVVIVRHHPDANIDGAIHDAIGVLKRNINKVREQAIVTMLWSLAIALLIPWPPVLYAMLPEVRGAIWIGAGICGLIGLMSLVASIWNRRAVEKYYFREETRWPFEDGPTLLPPVIAWRADDDMESSRCA